MVALASSFTLGLLVIAVLLVFSAFFSGSEIAIFSLDPHRADAMSTDDGPGRTLARLREDPHRLLVTILVGNNFVNIAIASVGTVLLVRELPEGIAITVSTLVISTVVLLFGEIVPKSYGVANPERTARSVARPLRLVQFLLAPVVTLFDTLNEGIRRLIGGARDIEKPYVSREELAALVETAEQSGAIDADEGTLIERVLRFSDVPVRQAMVPRADIVAVDEGTTVREAIDTCAADRLTRLPVLRDGEEVIGYVDLRDLADADPDEPVDEFLLPVVHVFEGREIDDVLEELQREQLEVAIVFDQFGAVEGLVTAEDIVEELVGEVFDVGETRDVVRVGPGKLSSRGRVSVTQINELLETDLPAVESGTLAALLAEEFGRVPDVGESVVVDGVRLTVRTVAQNRVLRVFVERLEENA
ncbi:hemolysin family protein [Halorarius litoreus]|uniref:hemolysin family protein n=1 Tax=Halorarius litoreus TaxID=2962676 RepID=UPI0020CBF046|nr:hemolysin family protein [Halorarius litoreus]